MRNKNLVPGLVLVTIGLLWLLSNLGFPTWFFWRGLFRLWPVFLVAAGINIIFRGKPVINALVWLLALALVVGYGLVGYQWRDSSLAPKGSEFKLENRAGTKRANLNIKAAAINTRIDSDTDMLFEGIIPDLGTFCNAEFTENDSVVNVYITQQRDTVPINIKKEYRCNLSLGRSLPWALDIDVGAANGNLDLTKIAVDSLRLRMGAGNIRVALSDLSEKANLDIKTGAANLELIVPQHAGVSIRLKGAVAHSNLGELGWNMSDGSYVSPEYHLANGRIDIDLDIGVGRFNVRIDD
jgi:hypothetical protein